MEIGYLGREGHLIVADTLGHKVRFRAYRIDEGRKSFERFGRPRPLEPLGEVTASVFLHRSGWSGPGEEVVHRSRARLYRMKTSHLLVGNPWKAVLCLHERDEPTLYPPYLSGMAQERMDMGHEPPYVLFVSDVSVKGHRRNGTVVELFALEAEQFTEFVVGKLRAVLEFETPEAATSFAGCFLPAPDPAALDVSTEVDISRSTELVKAPNPAGPAKGTAEVELRREVADMRSKWPGLAWSRWAENPEGRAASFALALKDLGLAPAAGPFDLSGLDKFLRDLPKDTLFAAFVMDAAAYMGEAFMATLGVRTRHRWTTVQAKPPQNWPVLFFDEVNMFVSPVVWLSKVWEGKVPTTLHGFVAQQTYDIRNALAFRHRVEFAVLGFVRSVRDGFKEFEDRIREDSRKVSGTSYVLGDSRLESRRLPYADFMVYYVTTEVIEPAGPRYLPTMAVPFTTRTQAWAGALDGTSPRCPLREDVAIVRLQGNEIVPLGVQIVNYPEVGPSFIKREGPLPLHAIAVSDKGQILTPRVREARPEIKDFLAPIDGSELGVPLSPYATVLGKIEGVEELVNPVTNLGLWRLPLDVTGFRCEVLIRKDHCAGIPSSGNHFAGRLWLAALLEAEAPSTDAYIR